MIVYLYYLAHLVFAQFSCGLVAQLEQFSELE